MTHRTRFRRQLGFRWHLLPAVALFLGSLWTALAGDPLPPKPVTSAPAVPPAASSTPTAVQVPVTEPASDPVAASGVTPGTMRGLDDSKARRVRREGVVVRPFNLQAPSFYALKARDSGRIINFLMTSRAEPLNWREFHGKVVIVSGREYLDHRPYWKGIPLLNVDTIEAVR